MTNHLREPRSGCVVIVYVTRSAFFQQGRIWCAFCGKSLLVTLTTDDGLQTVGYFCYNSHWPSPLIPATHEIDVLDLRPTHIAFFFNVLRLLDLRPLYRLSFTFMVQRMHNSTWLQQSASIAWFDFKVSFHHQLHEKQYDHCLGYDSCFFGNNVTQQKLYKCASRRSCLCLSTCFRSTKLFPTTLS